MMICRQCDGSGVTHNLAQSTDYAGNNFPAQFQGGTQGAPLAFPHLQIPCTGCGGTGKYNSFGATGT